MNWASAVVATSLARVVLPVPRRSPQDQRMQPAAFEQRPQRLTPSEHMGLTDHLGQAPRPHPVG